MLAKEAMHWENSKTLLMQFTEACEAFTGTHRSQWTCTWSFFLLNIDADTECPRIATATTNLSRSRGRISRSRDTGSSLPRFLALHWEIRDETCFFAPDVL